MTETTERVIPEGFCVGCGACAVLAPGAFAMVWSSRGALTAEVRNEALIPATVDRVCPFASEGDDETTIGNRLYGGESHPVLGRFNGCYTGYVAEGEFRRRGSSGGVGKWVLAELLRTGKVDYVIQVRPGMAPGPLFEFARFDSAEAVIGGARSAYYPITLADALLTLKATPGRYAVIALPCFSKALRRLAEQDPVIGERVRFIVSTVCGHLKTTAYAELLAWQIGVSPENLYGIDFRDKIPGKKANEKGVVAIDESGPHMPRSSKELFGGNWGWNFFKYKACDYCDDVMGETSDVTVGDAWLPGLVEDSGGNNVVVIRNTTISQIVREGIESGRLVFEACPPETIVLSQRGGLRHKTEGLSLRLRDDLRAGRWVPRKRVSSDCHVPEKRKHIYRTRVAIRERSHQAFAEAVAHRDLRRFLMTMKPLVRSLAKRDLPGEFRGLLRRLFGRGS